MNYKNKWVLCKRYPNRQNDYIGRMQCLFITKQTANTVYGVEGNITGHWKHKYHVEEVVRVITEEEKDIALRAQRDTRNNYRDDLESLHKVYSTAINEIAEGKRVNPFRLFDDKPDKAPTFMVKGDALNSLEQQRCPKDDKLGRLVSISIVTDPIFSNPRGIKAKWECQECHDLFETEIPYLEIQQIG